MYMTIKGLVLRVTDYNDRDALLTLLTHEHGLLTAKIRGLRRKNNPMIASGQLLAYSEFTLFEYKNYYTVNEARSIELFLPLQRDLQKLSLGTYFAQVAEVISQEDMPNPELLSLVLNCLYALSKLSVPELLVKAVFELRCACLAGYTPDIFACHVCGNINPNRFDISAGRAECAQCRSLDSAGLRIPMDQGVLDAMRYIISCDEKRLFSFSLTEQSYRMLAQLTESYLTTQLERGFSALDFYKSLLL